MAMEAVRAGLPADTRVLVYWDGLTNYTGESKTVLTEIVKENGEVIERVLKQYGEQDSTDPAVMKAVLQDVQYYAPAEVYGISLHGDGTGWFPPELNNLRQPMSGESYIEHDLRRPDNALTRAYGPDGEEYMSAGDLVEGLSQINFDYVIFDVCFMSSIESLYRLEGQCPLHSGFAGGDDGQGEHLITRRRRRSSARDYPIDRRLASGGFCNRGVLQGRELSFGCLYGRRDCRPAGRGRCRETDIRGRGGRARFRRDTVPRSIGARTRFFRPERLSEEHYRKRCGEECLTPRSRRLWRTPSWRKAILRRYTLRWEPVFRAVSSWPDDVCGISSDIPRERSRP